MELPAITQELLAAMRKKQVRFADLAQQVGRDEVWLAAAIFRQATCSPEEAQKIASALELKPEAVEELTQYPTKGLGPIIPTDPLVYRFYEILQVYGMPLKAVIQEKFGDGIMSAIDFTLRVEKEPDPKGERVKITLSGKFLPYKKW
ncbi:MAG: cyanase [Bacillota bacterium]